MNPITHKIKTGTVGELLVQLRLLEFDVQAAPPLKDSGNDLIAIRGEAMRAIQIKTTARNDGFPFRLEDLPKMYHALAIVQLTGDENTLHLDECRVFLLAKDEVRNGYRSFEDLNGYSLCPDVVDRIFPKPPEAEAQVERI